MKSFSLYLAFVLTLTGVAAFGPKYPITASWFRDRFSYEDWNSTLEEFQQQGGDTVFLRAPPIIQRTRDELAYLKFLHGYKLGFYFVQRDPDFAWCGSTKSSTGTGGMPCYDEAVQELSEMGLNVAALVTYEYEEDFSDAIMTCPDVDRKVNSSRVYYRIVLPAGDFNESAVCDFKAGSSVVVLLTSFAGTDPHELLLTAAAARNISVYFGLPAAAQSSLFKLGVLDTKLMGAYYAWVFRVLHEHEVRYSGLLALTDWGINKLQSRPLYDWLAGYYSTDECCLAQVTPLSPYVAMYAQLGRLVHQHSGKRMAISPYIDLNRSQLNATVDQHVQGLGAVLDTRQVDIIAVQEGRGAGKGCYYWPTQQVRPVAELDSVLDKVLHYLNPILKTNITFQEACSASNQEVFTAFEQKREIMMKDGVNFDLWLNAEAFEYLRDDPCLPVDRWSSGMGELLNRASKSRLDHALTVASARVQKVISFAWDSDFVCKTKYYPSSLSAEIRAEFDRPILANCSFHSPANKSIVLVGYNLAGLQQAFEINWPARGRRKITSLYGYYFELDWGIQHDRIPSLMYTQLYDLPNVITDLDEKGWVSVAAEGAYNNCIFEYDFTRPVTRG